MELTKEGRIDMSIASNLVSPPRQTTPSRIELAESTRDKLSRFGRRRRLIGMTRGLALTVAVACAALLVAVLVDGLIVHPVARWFSASEVGRASEVA